jgi:hypothetical protein
MATFVLIHGAGDAGWYWHLAEAELQAPDRQYSGNSSVKEW